MEILTESQKQFLRAFSRTELKDDFFLTGGTALSAFYLQHRLSEDLDFFTEQPTRVARVIPVLEKLASKLAFDIEIRRQFRSYLEIVLKFKNRQTIRCDFALDAPYRLKPVQVAPEFEILIDNEIDIACNKLSALYDRAEAKDFIDVFFVHKHILPFDRLLEYAKTKHVGLDDYWLAIALQQARDLGPLPKMVKPLDVKELESFFLSKAKDLMKR